MAFVEGQKPLIDERSSVASSAKNMLLGLDPNPAVETATVPKAQLILILETFINSSMPGQTVKIGEAAAKTVQGRLTGMTAAAQRAQLSKNLRDA